MLKAASDLDAKAGCTCFAALRGQQAMSAL
jgi:hypothetical protein